MLRKLHELYADYALKNPFYSLEMPIRCELFELGVHSLLEQSEKLGNSWTIACHLNLLLSLVFINILYSWVLLFFLGKSPSCRDMKCNSVDYWNSKQNLQISPTDAIYRRHRLHWLSFVLKQVIWNGFSASAGDQTSDDRRTNFTLDTWSNSQSGEFWDHSASWSFYLIFKEVLNWNTCHD